VDSYIRPPWFREKIEDTTDEHGSIAVIEKMLLLTWHDSSELTKEPVCDTVTPRSLPQHDSITPYSQVIEDVKSQLSFKETKLDGEADFGDVARSGMESSGLIHDESFGVDDLDLNLNEPEPIVEEVRTQELILEEEDVKYGNSQEDESTPGTYDDDEDNDFLVDEENKILEPNVDVHLFSISMDVPFDNIGVTNLVIDDVSKGEDVDVINTDGFDSDPGNDDETSNYTRRRLAELSREMEGVINTSGQWKVNLEIPVKAVQDQLQRDLELQISMSKAFRAKAKAEREIRGDHVLQYSMLRDYVVEL
ncbi:hypothetical protein Tco_1414763, partial [Tanacetum coccineum]